MSRPPQLTQWQTHLTSRFPELPTPVVAVLALYSFGLLLAHVSGLSTVVLFLVRHLGGSPDAWRKRLAEFYKEAPAKSGVKQGQKRRDVAVAECFAPLLGWILSLWSGRHLALALDVTNLGDRFHVLCISVVVRGVGIPVAWKVLPGGVKEAWNPHWKTLVQHLHPAVPADWTVIVLSDRGLESPTLFGDIAALKWHPLMRVKKGGKFRPTGWGRFYTLGDLLQPGGTLCVEGRAYAGSALACTLLASWEAGYAEPWLLLSTLPPEAGQALWYGLRAWIEQGFKVIKGGGWNWHKTRMQDAGRVERLWLVLAVATLWVVALGAEDEVQEQQRIEQQRLSRELAETAEQARLRQEREQVRRQKQQAAQQARQAQRQAARPQPGTPKKQKPRPQAATTAAAAQRRVYRVFKRGLAVLLAAWERGTSRWPQHLHPEPWPQPLHPATALTEEEFLSRQT
jgi:hypothetical protein